MMLIRLLTSADFCVFSSCFISIFSIRLPSCISVCHWDKTSIFHVCTKFLMFVFLGECCTNQPQAYTPINVSGWVMRREHMQEHRRRTSFVVIGGRFSLEGWSFVSSVTPRGNLLQLKALTRVYSSAGNTRISGQTLPSFGLQLCSIGFKFQMSTVTHQQVCIQTIESSF